MDENRADAGEPVGGDRDAGEKAAGLPPRAPAYDLRTGQPLDQPPTERAFRSPDLDDDADLGIWAPSQPGSGEPAQAYQPYQPTYQQDAYPANAYPPNAYQPTPPPPSQLPQGPSGPSTGPTLTHSGPPPNRRGTAVLAGLVGALVLAVVILLGVLLLHGSGSNKSPASESSGGQASAGTASGTSTPPGSGRASGDPDAAGRVAFVRTVDGILSQSASGRQQVSSVVTGVVNGCSVSPSTASATIRQVIVNRQSVLSQANALNSTDASTAKVKAELIQALNASIDANRGYQQWLDNLYSTYYNADPVGCPDGQAPTDANYDAATAASGRATAAKQTFVGDYNPLASAAGLRTWMESEF